MNAQLIKELYNAGFRLTSSKSCSILRELLLACDNEFGTLTRVDKEEWTASDRLSSLFATGSMPEEAVARLWLKLNEK